MEPIGLQFPGEFSQQHSTSSISRLFLALLLVLLIFGGILGAVQ